MTRIPPFDRQFVEAAAVSVALSITFVAVSGWGPGLALTALLLGAVGYAYWDRDQVFRPADPGRAAGAGSATRARPARDPGFEQALADAPDDWGARLVYADWLDDRGEHAYAAAHRWLAGRRRRPVECEVNPAGRHPPPRLYGFTPADSAPRGRFAPAGLPGPVFDRLAARAARPEAGARAAAVAELEAGQLSAVAAGMGVYYPSPRLAVEELAAVLGPEG